MNTEKLKKYFNDKNILILGYGKEGISSFEFIYKNYSPKSITIYDKRDISENFKVKNVTLISDVELESIDGNFDIIIKSPGIPLSDEFVNKFEDIISSQTDIFLREFGNITIGITGTKGKSTTATLTHKILKDSGKHALLGGNIGVPCFDLIPDINEETIVVLELSSHQLQYIKNGPKIAIFLNLYPEHLDFYKDVKNYAKAKMNILNSGNECVIYPKKEFSKFDTISDKMLFTIETEDDISTIKYIQNGKHNLIEIRTNKLKIKGAHNLYNIASAVIACNMTGCGLEYVLQSLYNFKGLEHRLEYCGKIRNIHFYNDSISTIPQTTIAALRTFNNEIGSLILGGFFRGKEIKFTDLAKEIEQSKVRNIFFLPETGIMIFEELLQAGFELKVDNYTPYTLIEKEGWTIKCFFANDFDSMKGFIFKYTPRDSICLLSPASSSYNMFKNFEERGNRFKEMIR
ncbi:MAG: UDP-N-acetylmuramoyl-L-alanine--D-glutamate ligase [Candidatus Delongbacteria bacterium]|jgi:UDP-N-acetylmuramoylalanine--D-glutamate ligase|nr:UDP-N-acetylmuramoyl-L-alanine--D-glutamate ligase [Candidatus Delongbacteria bacterium]